MGCDDCDMVCEGDGEVVEEEGGEVGALVLWRVVVVAARTR